MTRQRIPKPVLIAGAALGYVLLRLVARLSPELAVGLFWACIAFLTAVMVLARRRAVAEAADDIPSRWGPLIFLFGFGLPLALIITIGTLRDDS